MLNTSYRLFIVLQTILLGSVYFFESENIFSLKEDSQMLLSFQATMAEQESRNKSRSMETSLRMRLDHGLPLTPKLLGYTF